MDFGGLDDDGSVHNNIYPLISGYALDQNNINKCGYGSAGSLSKQERSLSAISTDEWRDLKIPKISNQDDFSKTTTMLQHQQQRSNSSNSSVYSQNMLCFSSPNTPQTHTLPYYPPNTTTTTGVGRGGGGAFTASQWMELEHQALIYKYITLNAPIPSNLLVPITKTLQTAAAAAFSSSYPQSHLRNATYGWGGFQFQVGGLSSGDPEPGRCRRTDGKKWRCSRDAVPDQKYCERHINRGRHRSRKPVEPHSGTNGPTTTTAAPAAAKVSPSAPVVTTSTSTILSHLHHQVTTNNRSFLNKGNIVSEKIKDPAAHSHSMLSPSSSIGLKPNPISGPSEFGLVCSDSLLNPIQKTNNEAQKSLHQFMDDWPHSDNRTTQLSISIPIGSSSDLMSSTSSPINLSPLRIGLGNNNNNYSTNNNNNNNNNNNLGWIPVSWETSMGGPLGEVLNHNNSSNNSPSSSALNLMTDGWESSSQQYHMTLSPTGVLQKAVFGSVSNSSAGSSPRTDNSLFGSTTLITTSSLPLL